MKTMKAGYLGCVLLLLFAPQLRGDDLRNDTIDLRSYRLNLDLRDFSSHVLYGSAVISIRAKQDGINDVSLDLLKLNVDSVTLNGLTVSFAYDDSLLKIHFGKAINKDDSITLSVYYHGKPGVLPGDFGGFYWDEQYAFNIGVSFVSNPHNYGRAWFPCFDNFKTRSYYQFFITTRATDKAFCNGTLQDVKTDSTKSVWHWKLNETIPSYLASVAVAAYVTVRDTVIGKNGVTPIEIAVLPEDTAALNKRFRHLHDAFHVLEHYWGPYGWERVGYCIVPFQEGAMEHATNIAFMEYYLNAYARECETTMAHELSHHWFGNLVTCDSAADMWLNEGWATYSQSLFIEGLYGADSARQYRGESHLNELQMAHVNDHGYLPVSGVPSKYTYGTTVYQKGADVIHTLRYYMGDSIFFSCVQGYLNYNAYKTASTAQLRDYLSACSGKDLTGFFNDWIYAPGYPHFSIADKYIKPEKSKYEVSINIRQRLSHATKLYSEVPVTISYFDRDMKRTDEMVLVSGASTTYTTMLDFKPEMIALDAGENLAQAITAEQQVVSDTGVYDFGRAMMAVQVKSVKDSALIRVEHSWLPADAMSHPIKNLHLNNARYWTVDGVFNASFKAAGMFEYSAFASDHLDGDFITNEDSLVMMYRPTQLADWKPDNAFYVDKGGSDSDNIGSVMVYPLKKGEYAIAIYNSQLPTAQEPVGESLSIQQAIKAGAGFKMYVDEAKNKLVIDFGKNIFERGEIRGYDGKRLWERKISEIENQISLDRRTLTGNSYCLTLTTKTGKRITKKLIN